jgi:hypothetical protein
LNAFGHGLSAHCEQTLSRELRVYEPALNEYLERRANTIFANIREVSAQLFAIETYDQNDSKKLISQLETFESSIGSVTIGEMVRLKWSPRLPWWVYVAPFRLLSTAMKKQFAATLDQLLAEYRTTLDSIICRGMEEYLDRVSCGIAKNIDLTAARINGFFIPEGSTTTVDGLLTRTMNIRRELDNEGRHDSQPREALGRGDFANRK